MTVSYFEIGIFEPKTDQNVGTLWRTAYQLGASGIFTIGGKVKQQPSDTYKSDRHIPTRHYQDFDQFLKYKPENAILVGIEMGGVPLERFTHPKQCIYLLGNENYGLPQNVIDQCDKLVSLSSINKPSYNVAVAGAIVMYSRRFWK